MSERTRLPRRARRRRALLVALVLVPCTLIALFVAVHRVPGFGPWLANGLRAVFGPAAVAWLETVAYGVEDRVNRVWRKDEAPRAHWQIEPPAPGPSAPASAPRRKAAPPAFRPRDVGAQHAHLKTPVDGIWVPIQLRGRDFGPPILHKTQLHPDAKRPWAEVFVVAADLKRARLHAVAGSVDPKSNVPGAKSHPRPAVIPPAHHAELLAAFNGGFKTEHGHYGMQVDGVTLVAPREFSCTIAARRDGSVEIRPWKKIRDHEHDMLWWRQTPPCLYEKGKMHGSLWEEESRGWGAAVGGEVVIRRSAIGLDESGRVLFVAIANFSTARAIADAMKHAGAVDIAQLDVNWTFPKFLVFQPSDAGALQGEILVEGFVHEPGEYIRDRSPRDFFYLTRSEP